MLWSSDCFGRKKKKRGSRQGFRMKEDKEKAKRKGNVRGKRKGKKEKMEKRKTLEHKKKKTQNNTILINLVPKAVPESYPVVPKPYSIFFLKKNNNGYVPRRTRTYPTRTRTSQVRESEVTVK